MAGLSVVIVNWNAGPALPECVASVLASEPGGDTEVILVDNASTDGSPQGVVRAHPSVRLLQNPDNRGFARAVNQGLRAARGELALLLNPDVTLASGSIPRLVAFMAKHPEAAVAAPRVLNPDGTVQGTARRAPSVWTGLFGRSAPLTWLFPGNPMSRREIPALGHADEDQLEVDWVAGACLMVRRKAWEAVGLMDERFFLYWEDADWCLRFRNAGWRVYYVPGASAIHRVGVSRAGRRVRSVLDFHRSAYYFYRRHYLPSAAHPMMVVLVGGLLLNLMFRLTQALLTRR